jgi:hypothetical protein
VNGDVSFTTTVQDFYVPVLCARLESNRGSKDSCSDYGISDFQNQRGAIQQAMEDSLRIKPEAQNGTGVDGVYAKAIYLQLSNVDLPSRYSEAISQKQSQRTSANRK